MSKNAATFLEKSLTCELCAKIKLEAKLEAGSWKLEAGSWKLEAVKSRRCGGFKHCKEDAQEVGNL
jgi:hypothetical protein